MLELFLSSFLTILIAQIEIYNTITLFILLLNKYTIKTLILIILSNFLFLLINDITKLNNSEKFLKFCKFILIPSLYLFFNYDFLLLFSFFYLYGSKYQIALLLMMAKSGDKYINYFSAFISNLIYNILIYFCIKFIPKLNRKLIANFLKKFYYIVIIYGIKLIYDNQNIKK